MQLTRPIPPTKFDELPLGKKAMYTTLVNN